MRVPRACRIISRSGAWALLLVLLAVIPSTADEIRVGRSDDQLTVGFGLDRVLGEEVLESLRSGLPSRVRHRVQVWQQRSTLWDRQVLERQRGFRVVFDLIEETYDLFDEAGLLETNLDLPELEERLAEMPPAPLCELERLDEGDRYYVVVEIVVEPLSVEEVRDLERWLQGSLREGDDGGLGRLPSQLLGVFKSRVGLGERRHVVQGSVFRVDELREDED